MKEKDQSEKDRRLDTPSESNREKHINFREVEEESSGNYMIDKSSTDRQKQWKEGIQEGEEKRQNTDNTTPSAMPMDEDDTLGVP
ncbi:MAG TPA: hypothetical protein VL095_15795 [Flavisolibacter sp.]|nr:hypothetical protein [Flavisolibacter sp.]